MTKHHGDLNKTEIELFEFFFFLEIVWILGFVERKLHPKSLNAVLLKLFLVYLSCPAVSQSWRWILKFRSVIPSTPVPVYIWTNVSPMLLTYTSHTVGRTFRVACQQPLRPSPLVFLWSRCPLWSWTCGWTCCRCTCGGRWSFPLQSPRAPEAWSSNHNPSQPLSRCVRHLPQCNMCWSCLLKTFNWSPHAERVKVSFW